MQRWWDSLDPIVWARGRISGDEPVIIFRLYIYKYIDALMSAKSKFLPSRMFACKFEEMAVFILWCFSIGYQLKRKVNEMYIVIYCQNTAEVQKGIQPLTWEYKTGITWNNSSHFYLNIFFNILKVIILPNKNSNSILQFCLNSVYSNMPN